MSEKKEKQVKKEKKSTEGKEKKGFFKAIGDGFVRIKESIKNLEKKKKIILGVTCLVVLILIIVLIVILVNSNNSGNDLGNTNNEGIALKDGSKTIVSYINTTDSDADSDNYQQSGIYAISSNGTVKETYATFEEKTYAYSLNKSGSWIYYMRVDELNATRDIVRTNGNKEEILVEGMSTEKSGENYVLENYQLMILDGNYIYYINENQNLARIKKNGKSSEVQVIRDEIEVEDFEVYKGYIYINNTDSEFIRISISDFEEKKEYTSINANDFQITSKYIYYMNKSDQLVRTNLEGEEEETIIEDSIRSFNVVKDNVYYFAEYKGTNTNSEENSVEITTAYAIFKLDTKKNETTEIVGTDTSKTYICVVGDWIYYKDRIDGDYYYNTTYRVKTDGSEKQDLSEIVAGN